MTYEEVLAAAEKWPELDRESFQSELATILMNRYPQKTGTGHEVTDALIFAVAQLIPDDEIKGLLDAAKEELENP